MLQQSAALAVVGENGKVNVETIKTGEAAKTTWLNLANTGGGNKADIYCPSCAAHWR